MVELVHTERGASDRPFAVVTAGVHGDEYEGPAAVARLIARLPELALRGTVKAIPVANPMAWRAAQRTSPDDGLNLARTFPGKHGGSPTERLAAELFEIAEPADYLIDLHSGGVEYLFLPLAGFYGEARKGNPSYDAARRFGLPVLWQLPPTDGVLSCELWKRGRTVVGCEYLGAGQLSEEGAEAYLRGVISCLALWDMVSEEHLLPEGGETLTGDWQLAQAEGMFHARCPLGASVQAGQLLAEIHDPAGRVLQQFHAGKAGRLIAIRSKAYIRNENWGVLIATPA